MSSPRHEYSVRASRRVYEGTVIAVRRDEVLMPDGDVTVRDVVEHPGAVGIVALDDQQRLVMVVQYRHPVGERLWELPAGLLDHPGEPSWVAAARELVEEAGLRADRWEVLADALPSPGMTDEATRVYLARDLHAVEQPALVHEETEMQLVWLPLAEAVERVLAGEIRNAMAIIGVLAAAMAAGREFAGLRPHDSPWPDRRP